MALCDRDGWCVKQQDDDKWGYKLTTASPRCLVDATGKKRLRTSVFREERARVALMPVKEHVRSGCLAEDQ